MQKVSESKQQRTGVGARIRRRRIELGIRQSALADRLGISASYLNLIEHDRRRIGGRLLTQAARELDVAPARLAQGAAGALVDALRAASFSETQAGADPDAAEALAGAFPDWAELVARQARRIAAQDQAIATLSDRLTHDPFLSESVHDVLSSVTAIRAAAGILQGEGPLDAEWLARFHRNIYEDSQRLADSAQALAGYLDAGDRPERELATPQEEAEAWFAARGWHVPALEEGAPVQAVLERAGLPEGAVVRALLSDLLTRYATDAAALPLDRLRKVLDGAPAAPDPIALAEGLGLDPLVVFRRLAALPEGELGPVGLVLCDGSGTLTFRRPIDGFAFPRYGAACPLWPLYAALTRPMQPVCRSIELVGPVPRRFTAYALSRPRHPNGADGPEVTEAAMLLFEETQAVNDARPVGTSCRICPREGCPARREPSLLRAGA